MSFHKRNISDYVKDIPMRFSSGFAQLPPESHLKSFLDLSSTYVDRLSATDSVLKQFEYDFNVERMALQDAERERERVLKEAEEKLKELELNKQLNETQVKKPVEDVINSDKPIQLTNAKPPTTSNAETTPVTSNYDPPKYDAATGAYPPFYYATSSNPTVSFNYNGSVATAAQEPSVSFSSRANVSTQSVQPNRSAVQPNLVSTASLATPQPVQTTSSPVTPQHTCLPQPSLQQTTLSQNSTVPTNLPNYYSAASHNHLARNQSTNLPPNQTTTVPLNQMTKSHPSDTGLSQSSLHQPVTSAIHQPVTSAMHQPVTSAMHQPVSSALYNPAASQLYSQSHHQLQTSLPNYNAYLNSPTNRTNYSTTNTTASIRGVYNPAVSFHAYPPNQMPHLNHRLPNSLNGQPTSNHLTGQPSNQPGNQPNNVASVAGVSVAGASVAGTPIAYSSTTYTTTNYVPSTYTNGILLPQQQSIASNGSQQVDDRKPTANKPANDGSSVAEAGGGTSGGTFTQAANLPFANRPNGKKIDVTDFENSSSPFDDALLRSIDDKEELNNIFQQFYNGAK